MPANTLLDNTHIMHQSVCLILEGANEMPFLCFSFYDSAQLACAGPHISGGSTNTDPMDYCCQMGPGAVLTPSPTTCTPCGG